MGKKIRILFIFIFTLIMFDRSIFYMVSIGGDGFIKHICLRKLMEQSIAGGKFNTLILGTSRTYEAVHPKLIRSEEIVPFKWSFAGHGPRYNYHFYRLFRKLNGIPKIVIYGVDPFIYKLSSSHLGLNGLEVNSNCGCFGGFFSLQLLLLKNKARIDALIGDIIDSFGMSEDQVRQKIEYLQNYTGSEKKRLPAYHVQSSKPCDFNRYKFMGPPGMEGCWFYRLLGELKSDKVWVVFLILPDHIGTLESSKPRMPFKKHLRNLCRKYKNISLMDYCRRCEFNLSDETLFLDGGYGVENSHLSRKGARVLNLKLKKYLYYIQRKINRTNGGKSSLRL